MLTPRELPLLAVFAVVVRKGSFTAAAKELGLAKSVVSAHLRTLEERCGVRLLERSTRSLRLTQVGEAVLQTASAVADAGPKLDAVLESHRSAPIGTLRIATTQDLAVRLVAPVAAQLAVLYPQLDVDIVANDAPQDLIAERFDVAVRLGAPKSAGHVVRRLAVVPEYIIAAPIVADGLTRSERPRDLAAAPWVRHGLVFPRPTLHFRGPRDEKETITVCFRAQTNSGEGVRALLLAGVGCGILPEYLIAEDLRRGTLRALCPGWLLRNLSLYAEMPSAARRPRRVQLFLEALKQAFVVAATADSAAQASLGWARWAPRRDRD